MTLKKCQDLFSLKKKKNEKKKKKTTVMSSWHFKSQGLILCSFQQNPKPKIPVIHFKDATPPFIICVKLVSYIKFYV